MQADGVTFQFYLSAVYCRDHPITQNAHHPVCNLLYIAYDCSGMTAVNKSAVRVHRAIGENLTRHSETELSPCLDPRRACHWLTKAI